MAKHKTIRTKLLGTYLIIIIFTALTADTLAYIALKGHYLQERQEAYQIHANVISTYAKDFIDGGDKLGLAADITDYGERAEARVLILNDEGVVLMDSFNEQWVIGRQLDHSEVVAALRGETAAGNHHVAPDEWVMYVTVPIIQQKQVQGIVLLTTDITDIETALAVVVRRMTLFTLLGSMLALAVGMWLATRVTKSVADLTQAVQSMAAGTFSQPVPVRSSDELGQLAQSFNLMAEKLAQMDKLRRDFVADASHELKSPLSSIKALAEALLYSKEKDVDIYREYLQDINEEIDRLNRVTHDLLKLASTEDVSDIEWQQQPLQQVIANVIELVTPQAQVKNITLHWQGVQDLDWPVNENLLTTVLLNLIDNGIKYTPQDNKIVVAAGVDNGKLIITVADSGEGIPSAELPHIFERFYRVDKARSRETGGTGLGLAIVKQSVQAMGGTIDVSSILGVGTTFILKLPYQQTS